MENSLNVLSCFDGISAARLALDKANIPVSSYYASEINKAAIKVTQSHFPDTIQLGDIRKVNKEILPDKIDLLVGGSPCQGFSRSGKGGNFDDPRSSLIYEFVRLKEELNPTFFLLENVYSMKKVWADEITQLMRVEPVVLNSKDFGTAQYRRRYYWTNIPILEEFNYQPVFFGDIKEVNPDKSDTYYFPSKTIFELPIKEIKYHKEFRVLDDTDLVPTISTKYTLSRDRFYGIQEEQGLRVLSRVERERLQGFPDGYTKEVPKTTAFELIGNAFTVNVIAYILSGIPLTG